MTGAGRVTGVYRVDPEEIFERTDRVKTLAGVIGEEAPESRERLDGRPEWLPLRERSLFEETGVESTANGAPEDNWASEPEAYRGRQQQGHHQQPRHHEHAPGPGLSVKDVRFRSGDPP